MSLRVKGSGQPLSEAIREAREAAHLSQVEFARELGVAARTVQNWESGRTPQPKHRRRLFAYLRELAA